jgi:hypothetical protein
VDLEILALEQIRDSYPAKLRELEEQLALKREVVSAKQELFETVSKEKQEKLEKHKEEEDRLKKWERRRDESKDYREVSALNREIDAHRRLNEELNEEILLLMEKEDTSKAEKDILCTEIEFLMIELENEQKLCTEKTEEIDQHLEKLRQNRVQFVEKISKSMLRSYDGIKRLRNGLAIVAARNMCCSGCNMKLRPQLYNEIQKMLSLETCPGCKRMLYWEEGLENGKS